MASVSNKSLEGLKESQELLLMKFADGECTRVESFFARRLMKRSETARQFLYELESVCMEVHDWSAPQSGEVRTDIEKFDVWRAVQRKIALAEGEGAEAEQESLFTEWIGRLGWGLSGGLIATSMLLLVIRPGEMSPSPVSSASRNWSSTSIVAPVSFGANRRTASRLEADWLKSAGTLRLIQDSGEDSTIIWVKKSNANPKFKAPRVINTPQLSVSHSGN